MADATDYGAARQHLEYAPEDPPTARAIAWSQTFNALRALYIYAALAVTSPAAAKSMHSGRSSATIRRLSIPRRSRAPSFSPGTSKLEVWTTGSSKLDVWTTGRTNSMLGGEGASRKSGEHLRWPFCPPWDSARLWNLDFRQILASWNL
jgi:hypothetical protein